ncbi:MAG: Hsp70 family protein, partial [Salaquimonas sp.]|nr:Hsp70 family protein [Salaquimonas sp.]
AEKSLSEHGDKVSEEDKSAIEQAIADLKASVEAGDAEDMKAKSEALANASMKLGQAIYEAAQAEAAAAESGEVENASKDEDVVDADFEEIDDDKDEKKSA